MRYLTLESIKMQSCISEDFHDDDTLLESMGDAAEDYVEQLVNEQLDDVAAKNSGELPASLYRAMLIFVDYLYSVARGSSGDDKEIPNVINNITKLYRSFL